MKQLRQFLKGAVFGVLAFGMVVALPMDVSAAARLSFPYKWPHSPNVISFRCEIPETSAVKNAMNVWNTVKDPQGNPMLPLQTNTNSNNPNSIYYINDWYQKSYIGLCTPTLQGTTVTSMKIWLNQADKTFSVGAKSGCYDIQTIVEHELGHALCIRHCHEGRPEDCFSSTCSSNVMNPNPETGKLRRVLQSYDRVSYQAIYGY